MVSNTLLFATFLGTMIEMDSKINTNTTSILAYQTL